MMISFATCTSVVASENTFETAEDLVEAREALNEFLIATRRKQKASTSIFTPIHRPEVVNPKLIESALYSFRKKYFILYGSIKLCEWMSNQFLVKAF